MKLTSLSYAEHQGDPAYWSLQDSDFGTINLIVGRNSAGKSRLLNVIGGLASMLAGRNTDLFSSGSYVAKLEGSDKKYTYELELKDKRVAREKLTNGSTVLLDRTESSRGQIWAHELNQPITIDVPDDLLAAHARRDSTQHPFFDDLYTWGSKLRHYHFGTPLGRDRLFVIQDVDAFTKQLESEIPDPDRIIALYARAYQMYGQPFDEAVLRDFAALGYDCTDVSALPVNVPQVQAGVATTLSVQERDLKGRTGQLEMSQGMFRALALVIHVNYFIFNKEPRTVLIDDIGEGLDFSRAKAFISMLIERADANSLQLIMTTNDRFVMNGVPLSYWGVLRRQGSEVRVYNARNSAQTFSDFEALGLNNFDFFATDFFEGQAQ
jgi:energy-coupling factor transporter ATP-binding protein EcfA2